MKLSPIAQIPPDEFPITFRYNGKPAYLELAGLYQDGTCCLDYTDRDPKDPGPLGRITVCIGIPLPRGHFWIKTWSENEQVAQDLLAQGVFVDTGIREPSGYVQVQCWRLPGYEP